MLPLTLELKNFFSHKDSSIDFTQFDSALIIGNIDGNYDKSNGSGKSALLASIMWCLFGKAPVAMADDVVSWGESSGKVVFTFKHNGEVYKISRKRSRSNSATYVDFSKQDSDGSWIDISGSTSSLTNAEIEKTIKLDHKTFINSIYFGQNDISEFAESDASRRKAILKSIVDISKWDEYESKAKDQLKEFRLENKILESKLMDVEDFKIEYEDVKNRLALLKENLEKQINTRQNTDQELQSFMKRYNELKQTLDTNQWDNIVELIESLKIQYQNWKTKEEVNLKSFEKYQKSIESYKTNINELSFKISELEIDEEAEIKITSFDKETIELKSKYSSSTTLLKILEKREITKGQCYVCEQEIGDSLYDNLIHSHQSEIEEHKKNQIYFQNKLNEIDSKIKKLEKLKNNIKLKQNYQAKIDTGKIELNISIERFEEIKIQKNLIENSLVKIKSDLELNKKILESIRNDDFKNLQKNISGLKSELQELNNMIEKTNHQVGVLTEKYSNLKIKGQELKDVKVEQVLIQKRIFTYEKIVKLLGKNGIQTILLNAVIEDLEKTANEILFSICDEQFSIFLDTQRLGSDGVSIIDTLDLRVKKDGIIQDFKSLSGGEKFRISLGLRIALSEISSRHGGSFLEFLLLDEINSPLDKHGTESLFVNVIKALEKKYKILVITHDESLKEKFNHIINVSKINGESSINYILV